jgi:hypothetical protein
VLAGSKEADGVLPFRCSGFEKMFRGFQRVIGG